MSTILSIGTAVPAYKHQQETILQFMQKVYALDAVENRKLSYLYRHSGIGHRYSVLADYGKPMNDWKFYPKGENLEPFPTLETRMGWFNKYAAPLSVDAIRQCIDGHIQPNQITHLITVSCTGMSAPGLDLQVMELMDLPKNIFRTSINFMGCYAAIHALKLADSFCTSTKNAVVMIVCTELCTLHFQKEPTADNIASSLLFADGSAAVLVTADAHLKKGIRVDGFYAEVLPKGKKDMSWELSSTGFLMTLSGYVPDLIEADFAALVNRAMQHYKLEQQNIEHWCIHPGGKRILEAIQKSLTLPQNSLQKSYHVLQNFGNMSSATILFVLKEWMEEAGNASQKGTMFGAAFGPGLTMETMLLSV